MALYKVCRMQLEVLYKNTMVLTIEGTILLQLRDT